MSTREASKYCQWWLQCQWVVAAEQQTHCVRLKIAFTPSDVGIVAFGIDISSIGKQQLCYLLAAQLYGLMQRS